MSEAKRGFALLGGAAVLVLAVTCVGAAANSATNTATTPMAIGPSIPAAPPTTSAQPSPAPESVEPTEEIPHDHDLGGGAGGGMG